MPGAPAVRIHRYTLDDYLAYEEQAGSKHEFVAGEIYAMAGGTVEHAAVTANVAIALGTQLRDGRCRVFSSDLKVRVVATDVVTYPDVTVICGPVDRDPRSKHVVLNPTLLVEVLSPSTQDWDRGEKLAHYQQIPSLRECLLVAHDGKRLQLMRREADGSWSEHGAGPGGALELVSIGCRIETDDVYRHVATAGT